MECEEFLDDDNALNFELPQILRMSWEDIWLAEIIPRLDLEDLFKFRGVCRASYELVTIFFTRIRRLDITNKRTFTLEAYQVSMHIERANVSKKWF